MVRHSAERGVAINSQCVGLNFVRIQSSNHLGCTIESRAPSVAIILRGLPGGWGLLVLGAFEITSYLNIHDVRTVLQWFGIIHDYRDIADGAERAVAKPEGAISRELGWSLHRSTREAGKLWALPLVECGETGGDCRFHLDVADRQLDGLGAP
jgi:hypothetical protein